MTPTWPWLRSKVISYIGHGQWSLCWSFIENGTIGFELWSFEECWQKKNQNGRKTGHIRLQRMCKKWRENWRAFIQVIATEIIRIFIWDGQKYFKSKCIRSNNFQEVEFAPWGNIIRRAWSWLAADGSYIGTHSRRRQFGTILEPRFGSFVLGVLSWFFHTINVMVYSTMKINFSWKWYTVKKLRSNYGKSWFEHSDLPWPPIDLCPIW